MRHPILTAAVVAALGTVCLSGCAATLGRFVTNVGAASAGNIQVEKCTLKYNSFTATYSTEECQTVVIEVMHQ